MGKYLVFLVLAVGLILPLPAMAVQYEVTATPLWTDTGISVNAGDAITVEVLAGIWSWGALCDASGAQPWEYPNTYDRFLFVANHGELIGYIGADPYQGQWGNLYYDWFGEGDPANGANQLPGYLHIGEFAMDPGGWTGIAGSSGQLWLGFNDDAVSFAVGDNSGSLLVDVTTSPVPEPGTLLLLGTGLVGLAFARRRKSA